MSGNRIVVGVDFSAESERALKLAMVVARRSGADIELVHAVYMDPPDASLWSSPLYAGVVREHEDTVRKKLGSLRELYSGQGVEVSHSILDRHPARALVEVAGERGATMVAVGTHGRTGIKRLFLGSIAEKVVRTSPCDVLVGREGRPGGRFERILVPTDFSDDAERALERAVELAADGAEVDLLHCWRIPHLESAYPLDGPVLADYGELIVERSEASAAPLLEKYADSPVKLSLASVCAPAVHGILERASGYDLIVIGSHGRRGVSRFFLGSVAEATIRRAPCSVLVTRAAREADPE